MKRIILLILVFGTLLPACRFKSGSGNIISETRSLPAFTGIAVSSGIEVELKSGTSASVIVEADDNVIESIETTVNNGQLTIRARSMNFNNVHMKVLISAAGITRLKASGGAEIQVKDKLVSDTKIDCQASGGASIEGYLDAPELSIDASGGADITLAGRTRDLVVEASGGASINAEKILSEQTKANVSSGASAHVHSSVSLDAHASSGGELYYRGGGTLIKSESSGGTVERDE